MKKAYLTELALKAVDWGPRSLVTDRGRAGPSGHSSPSPAMVYSSTAEPERQPPEELNVTPP
jgi:hypothetical protein